MSSRPSFSRNPTRSQGLSAQARRKRSQGRRRSPALQIEWLEARLNLSTTVTWTGVAGDGLWNTPGNWDQGATPAQADNVVISGATAELTSSTTVASLNLTGGATLTLDQSLTVNGQTQLVQSYGNSTGTLRGVGSGVQLMADGGVVFQSGVTLDNITLEVPAGAPATVANFTYVHVANGTRILNAGDLVLGASSGFEDDGTATFDNATSGQIEAQPYYGYSDNLEFAQVTNEGTIHADQGTNLSIGDAGTSVVNSGTLSGETGSGLQLYELTQQGTGSVATAGSVLFNGAGNQTLSGSYSAAGTTIAGPSDFAITGEVLNLGGLGIGGSTVDLTGATFGPAGETLASLTIYGGGTLLTNQNLTVSGQTQLVQSYGNTTGTVRGVGPGVQLMADGGVVFQSGVTLDNITLEVPAGAPATVANFTYVHVANGTRILNAGDLVLGASSGFEDDGTATFDNATSGQIEAQPYYGYSDNLEFAQVTNEGTIHADQGTNLSIGDAGTSVVNSGTLSGETGSGLQLYELTQQGTGSVATAGSVLFNGSGNQTLSGSYSAAGTTIAGPSDFAITGEVLNLGGLGIGGSTVDLTGATFGPAGETLASLTIYGGGTLLTNQNLTVSGQTQLVQSYGNTTGTVRGVGPGVQLMADGGVVFQSGVTLDNITLEVPAGAPATVANFTYVHVANGTRILNAGDLVLGASSGFEDDGTATFDNATSGQIEAQPYYGYSDNLEFAQVTNEGTIHADQGTNLSIGDAGTSVVNSGTLSGETGSGLQLYELTQQGTGSVATAGSVLFNGSGNQTLSGSYSAAGTTIAGPSDFAITGEVLNLGGLGIGGSTVDLTGATFGPAGETLASLTIYGGGTLLTNQNLTVSGQTQLVQSYGNSTGTLRGVGSGVQLMADGGVVFQSGVTLDNITLEVPAGAPATVANFTYVHVANGTRILNAGDLVLGASSGFEDDGTATFDNATSGQIEAQPYYGYSDNLEFAQVTNEGTIHADQGTNLSIGDAGTSVVNSGTLSGETGSGLQLYELTQQGTGSVATAGSVLFNGAGNQTLSGSYSAAGTTIAGPSDFAITGEVLNLGSERFRVDRGSDRREFWPGGTDAGVAGDQWRRHAADQ